jgi:hypothetical protein
MSRLAIGETGATMTPATREAVKSVAAACSSSSRPSLLATMMW